MAKLKVVYNRGWSFSQDASTENTGFECGSCGFICRLVLIVTGFITVQPWFQDGGHVNKSISNQINEKKKVYM